MKTYNYQEFCVAIDEEKEIYILEKNAEFYKLDKESFFSLIDCSRLTNEKSINENIIYFFIMICVIVFTLSIYLLKYKYILIDDNFFYSTLFLLFNILLHELGHIILLKILNPKSKIKIGFKFFFIYPAFYIDTSYSYLLPKYKRMAIYLAGNFMNSIFVLLVMIFYPSKAEFCYLIITNILINFIPIIKSDGYYAYLTLLNKYNKQNTKSHVFVEDFIRGIVMFTFLQILSNLNNLFL